MQQATPLKKVAPEPIEQPASGSPLRKSFGVDDDEKKDEAPKDIAVDAAKETEKPTPNEVEQTAEQNGQKLDEIELDSEDDDEEDEEVIIHEVHQAAAPQVINRARIVQVAKPVAPMLPPRNPFRNSRNRNSATSEASTERGAEEKPSPISTPSLRHGDSTSSLSSVEGDGLAHVSARFQPKSEAQEKKKEEEEEEEEESKEQKQDEFHEPPASPVKTVPGAF